MAKYTIKRLGMAFITLLFVACLTFLLMNSIPGSPWLSDKNPPQATIDALNEKYGLDKPVAVQLGKYLKNLAQGDMGVSLKMQKNRPVIEIIKDMFPVSAKIGFFAILWAIVVGVPLGCIAAYNRGKWVDSFLRIICTIGISMPSFVVASLLLTTFAGTNEALRLFPTILTQNWELTHIFFPVLPSDSIRCATLRVRQDHLCSMPLGRTTSKQRAQRVSKTRPLFLNTL